MSTEFWVIFAFVALLAVVELVIGLRRGSYESDLVAFVRVLAISSSLLAVTMGEISSKLDAAVKGQAETENAAADKGTSDFYEGIQNILDFGFNEIFGRGDDR